MIWCNTIANTRDERYSAQVTTAYQMDATAITMALCDLKGCLDLTLGDEQVSTTFGGFRLLDAQGLA